MQDILITIIGVLFAVILLFIFPIVEISSKNDELSEVYVESVLSEFVNTVSKERKITESDYDALIREINATQNSYRVQIELKILDDTANRLTTASAATLVGEDKYYSVFDNEIIEGLDEDKEYLLKKNDYIIVTVENTNHTLGTQLRGLVFGILGKNTEIIVARASSAIM